MYDGCVKCIIKCYGSIENLLENTAISCYTHKHRSGQHYDDCTCTCTCSCKKSSRNEHFSEVPSAGVVASDLIGLTSFSVLYVIEYMYMHMR